MKNARRVACQLSGSVNSAVAAYLLKQKGWNVAGVFINNQLLTKKRNADQLDKARLVADFLRIPLEEVSLSQDEWAGLKTALIAAYKQGHSPEIRVQFHKHVTYGAALHHINRVVGVETVCTGHLARAVHGSDTLQSSSVPRGMRLLKAVDQHNDDSLLLGQVPQQQLRKLILPLGEFTQEVIESISEQLGFDKLNDGTQLISSELKAEMLEQEFPIRIGDFVNLETGNTEGKHKGVHHHCVGDEISLKGGAFYVSDKNPDTQQITVVPRADHPALLTNTLITALPNWVYRTPYSLYEKHTMQCEFRTRPNAPTADCVLTVGATNEWCGNDHLILSSSQPVRAVTPGHFVAFYRGEECIGSASIKRPGPSLYAMECHKFGKAASPESEKKAKSPLKSILDKLSWPS